MSQRECAVENCHEKLGPRTKRVYCVKHQYHFDRYGDATLYVHTPPMKMCSVEGCDRPHRSHGYCLMHNARFIRHGDPQVIVNLPTKATKENRREYRSYSSMKTRCYNQIHEQYKDYGGRGIKVCDRWQGIGGFQRFLEDMGERPIGYTLDRIDNDGDYCPENCRWASRKEQSNNLRKTKRYVFNGEAHSIPEWAEITKLPSSTLYNRIMTYHWPIERALTTPKFNRGRDIN